MTVTLRVVGVDAVRVDLDRNLTVSEAVTLSLDRAGQVGESASYLGEHVADRERGIRVAGSNHRDRLCPSVRSACCIGWAKRAAPVPFGN